MPADRAPAERSPLIDSDDAGAADMGADPNRLALVDWAWLLVHAGCAGCDGLALQALLHRRFKGALFFGGHTQFLGNWSLGLSLASHLVAIYAAAAVEPVPNPYKFNIRRHDHRERVYYWQSMVSPPPLFLRAALRGLALLMVLRTPCRLPRHLARLSSFPPSPCSASRFSSFWAKTSSNASASFPTCGSTLAFPDVRGWCYCSSAIGTGWAAPADSSDVRPRFSTCPSVSG